MRRKPHVFIVGVDLEAADHFVAEPKLSGPVRVPHGGCENAVFQGRAIGFPEDTQLDLAGSIAALKQIEPHVSAVFELLDAQIDLQFLLSVRSLT